MWAFTFSAAQIHLMPVQKENGGETISIYNIISMLGAPLIWIWTWHLGWAARVDCKSQKALHRGASAI
jgi:hypothetical protein